MIAYIYEKESRKVINFFKDVTGNTDHTIYSKLFTYEINPKDDFIISDKFYEYGDVIPLADNSKIIKTEMEILQDNQVLMKKVIDEILLGGV